MELPKITISPNAFRVDGQELIVMEDLAPTIRYLGAKIYGVTVTIPSDEVILEADARYRYEDKPSEPDPLHTPAGTPFLGHVSGGAPQLVVRSAFKGDLESWWYLNGHEWLRADDEDVHIIIRLETRHAHTRSAFLPER